MRRTEIEMQLHITQTDSKEVTAKEYLCCTAGLQIVTVQPHNQYPVINLTRFPTLLHPLDVRGLGVKSSAFVTALLLLLEKYYSQLDKFTKLVPVLH